MITNFKIFEQISLSNYKSKVFWVIDNNDEYFETILFKIGMSVEIIEKFKNFLYKNGDDGRRHFYFGYDPESKKWSYENYNYTSGSNVYVDSFYKFMGRVEVNDKDKKKYEEAIQNYNDDNQLRKLIKRGELIKYNL